MTTTRRVLYSVAGAALLIGVLDVYWANYTQNFRYYPSEVSLNPGEPYSTIAGYSVSVAAFYLLGAGAVGGRLRSRYWFAYLTVAHLLAAVLVGGMAAYWEAFPPPRIWVVD